MRLLLITLAASLMATGAIAAGDAKPARSMDWTFDGIFGKVDQQAAQRGLQVYKEVCAACHGVKRIAFRNLSAIGFSEAEIKTLAAEYSIVDGPNDEGDMFERPGFPSDAFPSPYANEKQARATNNGAYPVDLSLIVKARPNGANYLYSLLTGYEDAPADMGMLAGQHYNPYMSGGKIAMPAPLSDGQVDYQDGTDNSKEQLAKDVTYFLQWAAEPEMEMRKQMGIKVILFLLAFTVFMFLAYRNLWKKLH